MSNMIFKVETIHGKMYDCECCGCYSSEGICIYVNDTMVWEKYSDGHMYGRQTEETILDSILDKWFESNLSIIEEKHTEKARVKWNKDHPGNGIARTPESWLEYKNSQIEYIKSSKEQVVESCKVLPYSETLQVKMIALWIEEVTGEKIKVVETAASDPADGDDDFDC
jgi:hypothetical protein